MRKNRLLSLILVLTLLVGMLVPGTIYADEETETPVAGAAEEQVIPQEDEQIPEAPTEAVSEEALSDEDSATQDSEELEGDMPAQHDDSQEADPPAQKKDEQNSSADPEKKTQEPSVPAQQEEPQESETPAGGNSAEEPEGTVRFESGYVRIKANTEVYADVYMTQSAGTFMADSTVYAKVETKEEDVGDDWLKITFDTEAAKAENAAFGTAFIQEKNVQILTEEEAEELLADLPEDARLYNEKKLPLVSFEKAATEEATGETTGETGKDKSVPDAESKEGEELNPTQQEEPQEQDDPAEEGSAGEAPADKPQEAARFESGYVWIKANTEVYTDEYMTQPAGTFTAYSVVYAEVSTKAEDAGDDWLKLTFDTEVAKAEDAAFGMAYIQEKNVRILTEEEAETLLADLPEDAREYNEKKLPLTFFEATIADETADEDSKQDGEEGLTVDPEDIASNNSDPTITSPTKDAVTGKYVIYMNPDGVAVIKGKTPVFEKNYVDGLYIEITDGTTDASKPEEDKRVWNKLDAATVTYNSINKNKKSEYTAKFTVLPEYIAEDSNYAFRIASPEMNAGGEDAFRYITEEVTVKRAYTASIDGSSSQTLGIGKNATFKASLSWYTSAGTVSYQWYYRARGTDDEGTPYTGTGAKKATVTIAVDTDGKAYGYEYWCVVKGAKGRAETDPVTVEKPFAVTIDANDSTDDEFKPGVDVPVTFTATVDWQGQEGQSIKTIEWWKKQKNGKWTKISGAAGETYLMGNVTNASYDISYRAVIINNAGLKVNSNEITVTRPYTLTINKPDALGIGQLAGIHADVSNTCVNPVFIWEYRYSDGEDWKPVSEGNWGEVRNPYTGEKEKDSWVSIEASGDYQNAFLTITATEETYAPSFRMRVEADNGRAVSDSFKVAKPYTVTVSPKTKAVGTGTKITWTATIKNAKSLQSVIWQRSDDDGETWTNVTSETGKSKTYARPVAEDDYYDKETKDRDSVKFRCVVTANNGIVHSDELTITRPFTVACVFPEGFAVKEGAIVAGMDSDVPLSVTSSVTKGVKYQWYSKTGDADPKKISGATGKTYTIKKVNNDTYNTMYRCYVTVSGAVIRSDWFTITSPFTATLISPADGSTVMPGLGDTATFEVAVSEECTDINPEISWEIYENGTWKEADLITKDGYRGSLTVKEDTYQKSFRAKVVATLDGDSITVYTRPGSVAKPFTVTAKLTAANGKVGFGETAEFTATLDKGTASLYRWQYRQIDGDDWTDMEDDPSEKYNGCGTAELSVKVDEEADYGKEYRCLVTATVDAGSRIIASDPVRIGKPFTVSVKPAGEKAAGVGTKVTWTATVSGAKKITSIKWQRCVNDGDWKDVKTGTSKTYVRTIAEDDYYDTTDADQEVVKFRCEVTADGKKVYSNEFWVVRPFNVTRILPEDAEENHGVVVAGMESSPELKVEADDRATGKTKKYQWYSKTGDGKWTAVKGATKQSYSPTVTYTTYKTLYRCAVTAGNGVVYSDPFSFQEPFSVSLTIAPNAIEKPGYGDEVELVLVIDPSPESLGQGFDYDGYFEVSSDGAHWENAMWRIRLNQQNKWVLKVEEDTYGKYFRTKRQLRSTDPNATGYLYTMYSEPFQIKSADKPFNAVATAVTAKAGIGDTARFSARADCGNEQDYLWQVRANANASWTDIENDQTYYSGCKTNELSVTVEDASDYDKEYRCLVTATVDVGDRKIASNAVHIERPFTVTVSPATAAVGVGSSKKWTPTVKGAKNIEKYTWLRSVDNGRTWVPIPGMSGAKASTFTRTVTEDDYYDLSRPNEATKFRLKVEAANGTVLSNEFTVKHPFTITCSDHGYVVAGMDGKATMTVSTDKAATGTKKYQWYFKEGAGDWTAITGATKESYTIDPVTYATYNTQYRCRVTASNGAVYSDPFTVGKPIEVALSVSPDSTVKPGYGQTIDLILEITETWNTTTYPAHKRLKKIQTSSDGKNWESVRLVMATQLDETGNRWKMSVVADENAYQYYRARITAESEDGVYTYYIMYSDPLADLIGQEPFTVSATPEIRQKGLRQDAVFEASATGGTVMGYQWMMWGVDFADDATWKWMPLEGEENSTLTITVTDESVYDNMYCCKITATVDGIADPRVMLTNPVTVDPPFTVTATVNPSGSVSFNGEVTLTGNVDGLGDQAATFMWQRAEVKEDGSVDEDDWCDFDDIGGDWTPELRWFEGSETTTLKIHGTVREDYSDVCRFRLKVTTVDGEVFSNPVGIEKYCSLTVSSGTKDDKIVQIGKHNVIRKDSGTAVFKVTSGKSATAFTWEYSEDCGTFWKTVTSTQGTPKKLNATSSQLTVTLNNAAYGRWYRCVATAGGKKVVSEICYVEPTSAVYYDYGAGYIVGLLPGTHLEGAIVVPAGLGGRTVDMIPDGASEAEGIYAGQTGITSVTIPATITQIGDYAFCGCTGLTTVSLSNGVTEIGQGAFKNCTHLNSMSPY